MLVVAVDRQEMAGWLALAISKDFMCSSRWEMAGRWMGDGCRAPVVLEHPIQNKDHQYNTNTYSANRNKNQMAGWLALGISTTFRMYI